MPPQPDVSRTVTDTRSVGHPAAIADSVTASNSPTEDDKTGKFHEEGGIAGPDKSGNLVVSPDKPGPYANPDVSKTADTTHNPANPDTRNSITSVTVNWHVHAAGSTATHNWKQPPSPVDRSHAISGAINVVAGAGNNRVYFYDNSRIIGSMSMKDFMRSSQ